MRTTTGIAMWGLVLVALFGLQHLLDQQAVAQRVPSYEVDPFWPKLPAKVTLGQVAGVAVDAQDHVWILQRPWSLENDEKARNPEAECCSPASPVMEFDSSGNYLQGWGGVGEGRRSDGTGVWEDLARAGCSDRGRRGPSLRTVGLGARG